MRSQFQERFQVYVMGPNQDPRLALIAPGDEVKAIKLKIDLDAPFVLRRRALNLAGLLFLKTKWTGATDGDYRQSNYILESLQQPFVGYVGNPKPVSPEITYPPGGTLSLDLVNTGANPIVNMIFYWIGVNLYPWGTLRAPTYPPDFRGQNFSQPFVAQAMGAPEIRLNRVFTAKSDSDLIIRGGQAAQLGVMTDPIPPDPPVFVPGILLPTQAMSVVLKDYDGMPYMNDWVDINVLFGVGLVAGAPGSPVVGGPAHPGIIYPEIYLPAQHQLLLDVQQDATGLAGVDLLIEFIGAKVFKGAK